MKIAREIAIELLRCGEQSDEATEVIITAISDEWASLIAAKLGPVKEALRQIAHYGHSDECDGWYDDRQGRINPDTGHVYRFNNCPIYECTCSGNANGVDQWDIAKAILALFEEE